MKIKRKLNIGIFFGLINYFLIANVDSTNILQVIPSKMSDVELLRSVESDEIMLSNIPFVNKTIYLSIKNTDFAYKLINILKRQNMPVHIGSRINLTSRIQRSKRSEGTKKKYFTWEEFEDWIHSIKNRNESLVEVNVIGKSFEHRNIYSIKIGTNGSAPIALVESGSHAREWLSIASVIETINKILRSLKDFHSNYWQNIGNKWILYFVPILNPDGYVYSMKNSESRFWRKNRQIISGGSCSGIDINRNYPTGFKARGSICNSDYAGSAPFTAPETQSLRNLVIPIKDKLKLYLSFHCFGEYILIPWAYTNDKSKDYPIMKTLATDIQRTIFKIGKKKFLVGLPGELLYNAGGTSFDWIKSLGVPFSYTIELSPNKETEIGFIVPEEFIRPSTEDVLAIITTALTKLLT